MIRILHVDDSTDDRELIRIGLLRRDPSLQITVATSVDEGLLLLAVNPFDCVICDFQMPHHNGTVLLYHLRESGNGIPFIFLTGQGNETIAAEVFRSGADDYFTKDIGFAHYDRLVNSIRRLVAGHAQRAERDLAERRYVALFENILDAVVVFEAVDGGHDFVFRSVNRAMEKIDQVNREEIIGRRVTEVFPHVGEFGLLEVLSSVWRSGEPALHPLKFYQDQRISGWRDNHVFRLPGGEVVAIYRDFTEQRLAELALKDNEAKYRTLFENARDVIYLWEVGAQGDIIRMLDANPAAERVMGFSRQQLLTMLPKDITAATLRKNVSSFVRKVVTTQHHTFRTEHLAADGRIIPVEVNSHKFPLGDKEVILSVVRDLSARIEDVKAEEAARAQPSPADLESDPLVLALRQKTESLEATNHELEGFAYTVAHDLQAPLRRVHAYADLMLADHAANLDEEGQNGLKRIRQSVVEMTHLVSHLLEYSRLTNRESQRLSVDLSGLAKAILVELQHDEPHRSVETQVEDGLTAFGDPQLLRLLLLNLLGNAWKYTSRSQNARIALTATQQDGQWVFSVHDNGIGFNPLLAQGLFKPFRRLESASGFTGTGIGLATALRIVHSHGGSIWAESREGEGASFHFTLP